MFSIDTATGAIRMHAGDTGSFKVSASQKSGTAWTSSDRMLWTVRNSSGEVVMQRIYRLDTDLGNGMALIEFNNSDTDTWSAGIYQTERRYVVNPRWSNGALSGDAVDALTAESQMVEGDTVRVPEGGQSTLQIDTVYGEV